jgi:hypothetical protein
LAEEKSQQSTFTLLKMPRGKGKANYKVDTLVMAVEELLPNGAQSWAEVAALYHRVAVSWSFGIMTT